MYSEKVGAFRAHRTEKVGAFRANKTQKGGFMAAHTSTALIWEYPLQDESMQKKRKKKKKIQFYQSLPMLIPMLLVRG